MQTRIRRSLHAVRVPFVCAHETSEMRSANTRVGRLAPCYAGAGKTTTHFRRVDDSAAPLFRLRPATATSSPGAVRFCTGGRPCWWTSRRAPADGQEKDRTRTTKPENRKRDRPAEPTRCGCPVGREGGFAHRRVQHFKGRAFFCATFRLFSSGDPNRERFRVFL